MGWSMVYFLNLVCQQNKQVNRRLIRHRQL
jgi:hypothetical protein